jgi:hypothetical protein
MRTTAEILAEIDRLAKDGLEDFFGARRADLIAALPYEHAKPYLNDDVTPEQWALTQIRDEDGVVKRLIDYMPFAWEKANGCRGLSAGRSMNHMQAWLWLLGEENVVSLLNDYEMYGKPQLRAICEHFNLPWASLDNGRWVRDEEGDSQEPYAAQLPFVIGGPTP